MLIPFPLLNRSKMPGWVNSRLVLGLYRKREGAKLLHEHGVFARFRYNDLKEAACDLRRTRTLCKFNGGKERRRTVARLCRRARHVTGEAWKLAECERGS